MAGILFCLFLQMPNGVPVATVALNAAKNAGLLAAQIIGTQDENVLNRMLEYKKGLAEGVAVKYNRLEKEGYETYKK